MTLFWGREFPQEVAAPILRESEFSGPRADRIFRGEHQHVCHACPAHNIKAQRVLRERRELVSPRGEYRVLDAEGEWNLGHIAGILLSLSRIHSAGQEE